MLSVVVLSVVMLSVVYTECHGAEDITEKVNKKCFIGHYFYAAFFDCDITKTHV
jgi:hypothetical protein